jgi:hypothetical protein
MDIKAESTYSGRFIELSVEERRLYPRVTCKCDAEAIIPAREALFRGQIRDISESGCYVDTLAFVRLRRGMEVDLRFVLQDTEFHFTAEVMNVRNGSGFGVHFIDEQSPDALEMLHCLIQILMQKDEDEELGRSA